MYKKICLVGVLSISLIFVLPLVSLAGSKHGPVPTPKAGVEMPRFLRVKVYFGKGTAGDSVVEAFLRGIRKMYPKINLRLIPGGSKAAIDRILANEADFGIGLGNFSYASWLGKKPFKKANTTDERFVYQIPAGIRMTWVVLASSDILKFYREPIASKPALAISPDNFKTSPPVVPVTLSRETVEGMMELRNYLKGMFP